MHKLGKFSVGRSLCAGAAGRRRARNEWALGRGRWSIAGHSSNATSLGNCDSTTAPGDPALRTQSIKPLTCASVLVSLDRTSAERHGVRMLSALIMSFSRRRAEALTYLRGETVLLARGPLCFRMAVGVHFLYVSIILINRLDLVEYTLTSSKQYDQH